MMFGKVSQRAFKKKMANYKGASPAQSQTNSIGGFGGALVGVALGVAGSAV